MRDSKLLMDALARFIKPLTMPVAVMRPTDKTAITDKFIQPSVKFERKLALCQGVAAARRYGWTLLFEEADHGCPASYAYLGFKESAYFKEGGIVYPGYANDMAIAKKIEQGNSFFEVPPTYLLMGALEKVDFEPELVLVYGNSAQIARIAQGINYYYGDGVKSTTFGRAACASYIVKALKCNEPLIVIPSGGERIFASTQDDELIVAIPRAYFLDTAKGIERVHKEGLSRFPTIFHGVLSTPDFPAKYWEVINDGR
ncbi:DUF169 domain-containing protein [Fusibacter paucivorans]|uniref:DUF169 domain-containing protein n=1 Tax=Fusibacter paucivorans TaxID=76009 RepID=A0ABS5PPF7_9FIRM|nr:DUF169 domain-containing protein [Fusibacter paucivorans]MBS7526236.1 DUF169 domain-containing protein [Fusibacter paucivorans]